MIRNIKALGLALVAVLAMSALVASAAQATEVELGAEAEITATQVEGNHVFTVEGNNVECTTATFASVGKVKNGATSVTVHPTYSTCTAFGFLKSSVTTTGCNYKLTPSGAGPVFGGTVKVECEGTSKIVIKAPAEGTICEAKVGNQEITNGNSAENKSEGGFMHVKLVNTNSTVSTEKTLDGFGCPFNGTGTVNATYSGKTTAKAYTNAAHTTQTNFTLK